MAYSRLLVLGAGYTGARALRLGRARGLAVCGTVRSESSAAGLREQGFDILVASELDERIAERVDADTHVVVAFPPDDRSDARIAPALPAAPDARALRILAAEQQYRAVSACVLRSPGIYGPDRGLHVRVLSGSHRIPGDGSRTLSRIHADDLAQFALAASHAPAQTFVVGDHRPAPHLEVVRFICENYGVPMPESVPLDSVHASLRADREVDPSRALERFQVTLRYPSYREGMAPAATGLARR
jgi:nucleoside-diphosphate-sugar epimerase